MSKPTIVAVCSAKGGSGASLVSCGIAAAFARREKKTLLLGLSPFAHSLSFFCGMQDRALFDFSSYIYGDACADRVLLSDDRLPLLSLCPEPDDLDCLSSPELKEKISSLANLGFDRVVIDLPRVPSLYETLLPLADQTLLVSLQEMPAVLNSERLFEELAGLGASPLLVLNRFDLGDLPSYKKGRTTALQIVDAVHAPLIGIVPENYSLLRRAEEGSLVFAFDPAADVPFHNIAARLDGAQIPLFEGCGGSSLRKKL